MTVTEAFEAFRHRLEITETEQTQASTRHRNIREHIRQTFKIEQDFLTGSYSRDTKTKPLKDVDMFCVLEATKQNRDRFASPSETLEIFHQALDKKYGRDRTEISRRSVKVDFGPDEHLMSFDVVPAFQRGGAGYEIPDNVLEVWIRTDPTVHADLATEKNQELSQHWKPLVKMVKAWNRSLEEPIRPSFLLEVMAIGLVKPPFSRHPFELQYFFLNAADEITNDWPDPAGLGPPVNDQMNSSARNRASSLLEAAGEAAEIARQLENQGKTAQSIKAWRQLMGSNFPAS